MTQWVEIIFDGHSLYLFVNKTYTAKLYKSTVNLGNAKTWRKRTRDCKN